MFANSLKQRIFPFLCIADTTLKCEYDARRAGVMSKAETIHTLWMYSKYTMFTSYIIMGMPSMNNVHAQHNICWLCYVVDGLAQARHKVDVRAHLSRGLCMVNVEKSGWYVFELLLLLLLPLPACNEQCTDTRNSFRNGDAKFAQFTHSPFTGACSLVSKLPTANIRPPRLCSGDEILPQCYDGAAVAAAGFYCLRTRGAVWTWPISEWRGRFSTGGCVFSCKFQTAKR